MAHEQPSVATRVEQYHPTHDRCDPQVNQVIGVDLLAQSLLPAIEDLAEDKHWRVRLAIIEYIPLLASQLGADFFEAKLGPQVRAHGAASPAPGRCRSMMCQTASCPAGHGRAELLAWQVATRKHEAVGMNARIIAAMYAAKCPLSVAQCMKWLEDQVFSIREAATKNLQQLASEFGPDWAKEHLVPQVWRLKGVLHYHESALVSVSRSAASWPPCAGSHHGTHDGSCLFQRACLPTNAGSQ